MKKYLALSAIAVAILALAGYLFLLGRTDRCKSVIPEDAAVVIEFRGGEFVNQMGFSIQDLLFYSNQSGEDYGIEVTKPVYCFVDNDGTMGLVLPLSDADDFTAMLEKWGFSLSERQGLRWAQNPAFAGGATICYDDDRALYVGPVASPDDRLLGKMKELMGQKEHEVKLLSSMDKAEGFFRLSASLDMMPSDIRKLVADKLPKGVDLSSINVHSGIGVDGSTIRLKLSIDSSDERIDKDLSTLDNLMGEIEGSLLSYTTENPLLWYCFHTKGKELLEQLRRMLEIRTALIGLNMIIDADMIIRAIDGDVSVMVPAFDKGGFPLLVLAELDNTDFLKNVPDWGSSLAGEGGGEFEALTANDFRLSINGNTVYFGVSGNKLYVSNLEPFAFAGCLAGNSKALLPLKKEICAHSVYCNLSLHELFSQYKLYLSLLTNNHKHLNGIAKVDRMAVMMDGSRAVTIELSATEDIKDILKSVLR